MMLCDLFFSLPGTSATSVTGRAVFMRKLSQREVVNIETRKKKKLMISLQRLEEYMYSFHNRIKKTCNIKRGISPRLTIPFTIGAFQPTCQCFIMRISELIINKLSFSKFDLWMY